MARVQLRAARPEEAGLLSDLAVRSKGHWGYPPELLDRFRAELTVTPEMIDAGVIVAAEDEHVHGFAAVVPLDDETADLRFLFVAPSAIGAGIGRLLWHAAVEAARRGGACRMRIESDPYAAGFYVAMGARRIGQAPGRSVGGRTLPLLELAL